MDALGDGSGDKLTLSLLQLGEAADAFGVSPIIGRALTTNNGGPGLRVIARYVSKRAKLWSCHHIK